MAGSMALAAAYRGAAVAWVVPTYRNARPLWRFVEQHAATAGQLRRSEMSVQFGRGHLTIYTADNDVSLRGEAFDLVIVDEAAQIKSETWTDVIMPTLADRDGRALLISTPKGRNWFWAEYERGRRDGKRQASFTAPTSSNPNPNIRRAAQLAKARVTARTYEQEWLAQFVADGSYFTNVSACATIDAPDSPAAHDGHTIYMGIDWGISNDFTVATLLCPQCNRVVDWFITTGGTFVQQRARVAEYARRWNVQGILPERNSIGQPNIEILFDDGLPIMNGSDNRLGFFTTAINKAGLIERLKLALEKDGLLVPSEYAMELNAFEITTRDGSPPKFSAPDGQHDDRVISLALSVQAALSASGYGLGVL